MRLVRILLFLILSVFLLATVLSCFSFDLFCEPDENCVYVYIINSSSRQVEVDFSSCCEEVSIPPRSTAGIYVLLGHVVWANGRSHVFRYKDEIWEIW
jgi:hypothetical protein